MGYLVQVMESHSEADGSVEGGYAAALDLITHSEISGLDNLTRLNIRRGSENAPADAAVKAGVLYTPLDDQWLPRLQSTNPISEVRKA